MNDPHAVLGITPDAEPEVVDAAYRALMKKYHPDRWHGDSDEGRRKAQAINEAYAAIRSRSGGAAPTTARSEDIDPAPTVLMTPPYRVERSLAWATGISAAIVAGMALLATGGR